MSEEQNATTTDSQEQPEINSPVEIPQSFEEAMLPTDELVKSLREALELQEKTAKENWDKLLRKQAECENIERQSRKRVQEAHQFAIESFVKELFSVLDTFDRALMVGDDSNTSLNAMKEGIELTQKQLMDIFEKFEVRSVAAQSGDAFDPSQHEALTMQVTDQVAPQHILTVVQQGYTLHGRLVRPAKVIVAKAP